MTVAEEIEQALREQTPVVALESTLIAHGLPWPANLETALESERAIRDAGAIPATIAVWNGRPAIGLTGEQLEQLALRRDVAKASRRDLAAVCSFGQTAATTVAATMHLAHAAGIEVFATGGIGGVHRLAVETFDISADLMELARTPVLVACAGAKSILDLPRTLELLETLAVPVVGYRCDEFPAFYVRESGLRVPFRVDASLDAARHFALHRQMDGAGTLLVQPVDASVALSVDEFSSILDAAEKEACIRSLKGPEVTPFLLRQIAERTAGRSIQANRALIVANARLAAEVAVDLRALR